MYENQVSECYPKTATEWNANYPVSKYLNLLVNIFLLLIELHIISQV